MQHKFKFGNLTNTLEKYLDSPGIPRKKKNITPPSSNMEPIYNQIHQLTHFPEVCTPVQHEDPDFNVNYVMHWITNNKDGQDLECMICGDKHKFEECPTLQKCSPDLRSLLIKLCFCTRKLHRTITKEMTSGVVKDKKIHELELKLHHNQGLVKPSKDNNQKQKNGDSKPSGDTAMMHKMDKFLDFIQDFQVGKD